MTILNCFIRAVACALLFAILPFSAQAADKHPVENRMVFQVSDNDPARWNLVLNNVKNLQKELGKGKVQIEVVAFGPGINMLKFDSEVGGRLQEAADNGVTIAACGNTMKAQNLAPADMHSAAKVVPAGIVELMRKQQQGWAYIRP